MKNIRRAIEQKRLLLDLEATDMSAILRAALEMTVRQGLLDVEDLEEAENALQRREREGSTAIGYGVAVPHAYLDCFKEQIIVFVRLARPVNLGAPDRIPTRFAFVMLGPEESVAEHIDTLTSVARLMSDDQFRYEAAVALTASGLLRAMDAFQQRTAPVPVPVPPTEVDELTYTGRLFGGLMADVRRRLPHYWSDFADGLHSKALSSTLFLYFACLAPAIMFGGLMGIMTEDNMGAIEMLVATAVCGVVYALMAGQPLVILGGTGPLLIFTAILYRLCGDLSLPFLPVYAWVGLWTTGILLVLAATDAGCLMRHFTRFTDESFSALISVIFIYEAIKNLVEIFQDLDENTEHDTALLSLLLALGTFYIAMSLTRFRRSAYLLPYMREFLADFAPTIAIAVMTFVAVWLHEVDLSQLDAPEQFGTTIGRNWQVDLMAAPVWARWAAAVPAILVAVLIFLDQNITARIVNSPDHKLLKGAAYHLDLAIVAVLVGFCSLFGLPWLVAATVRSLNHVRSLATVDEVVMRNGQTKDRINHVRENRVTGLTIHLLIGASLLLLPWIRLVPMAVLYGLFLFMGVVSMSGNQFFERLSLWLRDPALYPSSHYIRRVPMWIIHAFTAIQLTCLAVLWVVKTSAAGILFPLLIALLVPVRLMMGKYFSEEHLDALDAEEEPEEEETHWAA